MRLRPITIAALAVVAVLIIGLIALKSRQNNRTLAQARLLASRVNVVGTVGDDSHPNERLAMSGDLLVGATLNGYSGSNVLRVYDVSDPASPQSVGAVDVGAEVQVEGMSTHPTDFAVEGTTLSVIVATGQGPFDQWDQWSMKFIDLNDPAQPKTLGSLAFDAGTRVYGMDAQHGFVYVRTARYERTIRKSTDGALLIIDARDPARPVQVATLPIEGQGDFDVKEDMLWIDTVHGLTAVDVSDPVHPHVLSTTPIPPDCRSRNSGAHDVRFAGTWVLIHSPDLCVIDGADPAAPQLIHRFEPGDTATSMADLSMADLVAVGDRAYATYLGAPDAGIPGLAVYDLASPDGPQVYAWAGGLVVPWVVAATGDYVYTTGYLDSDQSNHELIVLEVK